MNSYIDLDFKTNYKVWCYLQRKRIECDNTPIINGAAVWPVCDLPSDFKMLQWRLSFDDANGTVKRTIDKLLNMIDNGLEYCPFCGGIAELIRDRSYCGHESCMCAKVRCTECGCATPSVIIDGYYGAETTEKDAIDKWNRRA